MNEQMQNKKKEGKKRKKAAPAPNKTVNETSCPLAGEPVTQPPLVQL